MLNYVIFGIAITVVVSVICGYGRSAQSSRSVRKFYLANRKLNGMSVSHLLNASSMSLNGLFYHAWLGYQIGIYSILIQVAWAGSFLWFIANSDRFIKTVGKDSLFGNIGTHFGDGARIVCVLASCTTMVILIGWEASIAGSLSAELFGLSDFESLTFVFVLLFSAALYTLRGGIFANATANVVQNWCKIGAMLLIASLTIGLWTNPSEFLSNFGYVSEQPIDRLKLDPVAAIVASFGIFALSCNLFFSIFWQPADPTAWQNVSAGLEKVDTSEKLKKTLWWSAAKVLFLPGVVGTFLGMSLAAVPNLSEPELIPSMFRVFDTLPYRGVLLVLLTVLLTAAMLSTMDGLLLGVSYSFNRDVLNGDRFENLVENSQAPTAPSDIERNILKTGRLLILGAGMLAITVFYLVQKDLLGLFETAYFAVIGQMAVAPVALKVLRDRKLRPLEEGAKFGWLPVSFGLLGGIVCLILFLFGPGMVFVSKIDFVGGLPWLILAPPVTFVCSYIAVEIWARKYGHS